jgi:hypothetical protein
MVTLEPVRGSILVVDDAGNLHFRVRWSHGQIPPTGRLLGDDATLTESCVDQHIEISAAASGLFLYFK